MCENILIIIVVIAVRLWVGVIVMRDDLISREDPKQAIRHKFKTLAERCEINEVLNSMPSVQPKEKTGHWEIAIGYDIERTVMCDQCRKMAYEPSNFCPNCGAKMEVKENAET